LQLGYEVMIQQINQLLVYLNMTVILAPKNCWKICFYLYP